MAENIYWFSIMLFLSYFQVATASIEQEENEPFTHGTYLLPIL